MSAAIGCEPPKDNCNDCKATTAGSVDNGGGGSCHKSSGGGPGATLRYRSRGAGHPGFPGAASHSPPLGRHWSHDYAQRIVPDPNEAHVWLITETASFREFSDLVGGVYETNSPSDEYRELRWTNPGWELHDLDGTVMVFDGDGKWTQTIKPAGPATAKTATYNTSDQLESVAFPDGRREDFIYYPAPPEIAGKLWTITEVGVDGTTTRVWTYGWNADGDLTSIVRPDGSTLSYTYHPTHPGFLIREELEPAGGGQKRVLRAWDYDTPGRVTKVWRGHVDFANGVDGWQLAYTSPTTTEITDPLGNTSTYTYDQDPGSTTTRITQIEGDCPACGLGPNSVFEYTDPDNPLQPTAIIDGRGIRTELSYDENGEDRGLLTSKIEAVGTAEQRATWWEYTDSRFPGLPTAIVQESVEGLPTERRTDIVYHAVGAPQSRTISGVERGVSFSHSTTFDYNAAGQPIWIDPPGFGTTDRTSFGYTPPSGEPDRNGMLPFTRTDPLVGDIADTAFAYDAFNRRIAVTDPNGVTMETQYDELDRGTKTIHRTGTLGIDFNLGDAPQAGDLVTESLYNVFGDLEQTILPKLIVIEYGYDSAGRLESIARRLNTASPIAECTSFVLDGTGNREREELWKGECYTGTSTSFTMFHYKNRLQLEKIQYADGAVTEYAYDANGNLEKVWDANHPKGDPPATPSQTYVYDELNRLREVHQPWGGGTRPVCQMGDSQAEAVTRYSYDEQDHLESVTDAECNTTSYIYSDRDLLTSQASPVSGTTSFTYNEHGELVDETDARAIVTHRTPDALDRVTKVEYLVGGTPVPGLTTGYDYGTDPLQYNVGRLTSITGSGPPVLYTYDRFGRVLQDGALTYDYDANGNRDEIVYPSGVTASYGYDFADRQESLSVDGQNIVTGATYLPSGPLGGLDLGNGLTETRGFTTRYFPQTIDLSGNLQRTWTYTTDDVGNIEQIVETTDCLPSLMIDGEILSDPEVKEACMDISATNTTIEGPGPVIFRAGESIELNDFSVKAGATFGAENDPRLAATTTFTYGYQDTQYFLTCATGPWGPEGATCEPAPSADALQWTYDRIGNRLSEVRTIDTDVGPFTTTDIYTYILNAPADANTPILLSITHDGSLAAVYAYGPAGHLEKVDRGANEIDFTSDEAGRLSELDRNMGADAASFIYDGRSFLQHAERPLGESDQATTDPTYSSEGRLYCLTRQEDVAAMPETVDYFYFAGRPVAQRHGDGVTETWTFLTTDHLGTPAIATDLTGEETWLGPFEPFGRDYLAGTGPGALDNGLYLRLPGQWDDGRWADASLGADLYYNVHRWYENQTARYTRPDPEWAENLYEFSGQPAQVYGYAESVPTTQVDPLGLASFKPGRSCRRLPPDKADRLRSALADAAGHLPNIKPCENLSQGSRTIIVRCGNCGGECGHFRPRILVFNAAICINSTLAFGGTTPDGKGCGVGESCLASTLLHEMVHACGGQHPTRPGGVNPYACEKRFYPNCRQHIPNDVGDCPCTE